eukprot:scaffold272608_cov18-Tisochrysis_lutea.AAC.2
MVQEAAHRGSEAGVLQGLCGCAATSKLEKAASPDLGATNFGASGGACSHIYAVSFMLSQSLGSSPPNMLESVPALILFLLLLLSTKHAIGRAARGGPRPGHRSVCVGTLSGGACSCIHSDILESALQEAAHARSEAEAAWTALTAHRKEGLAPKHTSCAGQQAEGQGAAAELQAKYCVRASWIGEAARALRLCAQDSAMFACWWHHPLWRLSGAGGEPCSRAEVPSGGVRCGPRECAHAACSKGGKHQDLINGSWQATFIPKQSVQLSGLTCTTVPSEGSELGLACFKPAREHKGKGVEISSESKGL